MPREIEPDVIQEDPVEPPKKVEKTIGEILNAKRKWASKLIRIQLICHNPDKNNWNGEIFSAGNRHIGVYQKFVPFGNEEGWHTPQILVEFIKTRQYKKFKITKGKYGIDVKTPILVPEFTVIVMPSLNEEEMKQLAQFQINNKSFSED